MFHIPLERLSPETFREFGCFADMSAPNGYSLDGPAHKFFRDTLVYTNNTALPTSFSTLQVKKPDRFAVAGMEYHNYAAEAIMPLDNDVILCLAPANGGTLSKDEIRAFLVPKGTMVLLRTAVWHALPMSKEEPWANLLIVLPERVYHNDLVLGDLDEEVVLDGMLEGEL